MQSSVSIMITVVNAIDMLNARGMPKIIHVGNKGFPGQLLALTAEKFSLQTSSKAATLVIIKQQAEFMNSYMAPDAFDYTLRQSFITILSNFIKKVRTTLSAPLIVLVGPHPIPYPDCQVSLSSRRRVRSIDPQAIKLCRQWDYDMGVMMHNLHDQGYLEMKYMSMFQALGLANGSNLTRFVENVHLSREGKWAVEYLIMWEFFNHVVERGTMALGTIDSYTESDRKSASQAAHALYILREQGKLQEKSKNV